MISSNDMLESMLCVLLCSSQPAPKPAAQRGLCTVKDAVGTSLAHRARDHDWGTIKALVGLDHSDAHWASIM